MEAEIGDLELERLRSVRFDLMILTCPECATSYFIDDARLPPAGRTVKCSSCGAKWAAIPETPPEPEPETPPPPQPRTIPPVDDVVIEGPPTPTKDIKPKSTTPPPPQDGRVIVLAVAAGVIAALIAGLLVFRNQIVHAWPASGAAFATVGVRVQESGLVIESVATQAAFQGGRPVLSVTGQVRNIHDKPTEAPALRVNLLDTGGKFLTSKIAQPINGVVPGRAIRHFAITVVDPPANMSDLEVTFDPPGTTPRPARRAGVAKATGPAPVEATPLPAGSPDALPPHE